MISLADRQAPFDNLFLRSKGRAETQEAIEQVLFADWDSAIYEQPM